MKKANIISALVLTMSIGIGATVYAATGDNTTATGSTPQRMGLGRITSMKGYDYVSDILKIKLGLSDVDITNAVSSGKTLYDLAIEKGMSQEELKASLIEEKIKGIDEAVAKGTITKEEGDKLKSDINANMKNCTGNFGQRRGMRQGNGRFN